MKENTLPLSLLISIACVSLFILLSVMALTPSRNRDTLSQEETSYANTETPEPFYDADEF